MSQEPWECSYCGHDNHADAGSCEDCGRARVNADEDCEGFKVKPELIVPGPDQRSLIPDRRSCGPRCRGTL